MDYLPSVEVPDPTDMWSEVFSIADIDGTLLAYKTIVDLIKTLSASRDTCKIAITRMVDAETKTRRLIGSALSAKLTMPDKHYEQDTLKLLIDTKYGRDYLRVERVGIKKREFDKLRNGTGIPEMNAFRDAVLACESESTRLPSITIEGADES